MTPCMFLTVLCVVAGTAPYASATVSIRLVSGDGPSSPLLEPQPKRRRLIQCGNGGTSLDDTNIFIARDLWFADRESAQEKYGEISTWGTCGVSSFYDLFSDLYQKYYFNEDISQWDTSGVVNMRYVFTDASSFKGDLGGWDVANVREMNAMFQGASAFNQDLSQWYVENVTTMSYMFEGASAFDRCLMWDTEGKDTNNMFRNSPGRICPPTSAPTTTPTTSGPTASITAEPTMALTPTTSGPTASITALTPTTSGPTASITVRWSTIGTGLAIAAGLILIVLFMIYGCNRLDASNSPTPGQDDAVGSGTIEPTEYSV